MTAERPVQIGVLVVYFAMLAFPFSASTLLAPAAGVAFLVAGWAAGLALVIWLISRRSRWAMAMPVLALAFWAATVWAGDVFLGWTA